MESIKISKEQIHKLAIMSFTLLPKYFNKDLLSERYESDKCRLENYYLITPGGFIHYMGTKTNIFGRSVYEIQSNLHWIEFLTTYFQEKLYCVYDTFVNGTGADYFLDLIESNGINSNLIDKMFIQFNQIDEKTFNYYNLKKIK